MTSQPQISVIVPVFNESENVRELCDEIHSALSDHPSEFEVIFVNDGSTDQTQVVLEELAAAFPRVRIVALRRNSGQTAAMSAGIDAAAGEILVPMDGDRQNDPADIPRMLELMDSGHDVVSGWRKDRKDKFITRRIPSMMANWIISRISGVRLHDYGCTLKTYRSSVLRDVRLYGEMHRFVPIYASWQGASVTELAVNHRPRIRGVSKYGLSRTFRVILDLVLLRFLDRYSQRPMHLFGGIGLISLFLGFVVFGVSALFKLVKLIGVDGGLSAWVVDRYGKDFVETPLPILVALCCLAGVLSILMGLLAEMVMRTYYESQDKRTYTLSDRDSTG